MDAPGDGHNQTLVWWTHGTRAMRVDQTRYYSLDGVAGIGPFSLSTQRRSAVIPDVPEFAKSPVVEVALAVGFQPLPGYRSVEFGYLWDRYREAFPNVTEQAPIEMPVEKFGQTSPQPQVSFQILDTPPAPRLWFTDKTETDLIQVQSNWFARNWRKMPTGTRYPRYPVIRGRFAKDLRIFLKHIGDRGLGKFRPTQCEVSYINHIPLAPDSSFGKILRIVSAPSPGSLSSPEGMTVAARYVFGRPPIGRLHVTADSGTRRSDNQPIMVLTLTARGAPRGEGIDGVLEFLDVGHVEVVRAFDSLTTDAMHTVWGKATGRTNDTR